MKHSPEEWKEIIKEFKESGLSQRKWCAIHDEDRNRRQFRCHLNCPIFMRFLSIFEEIRVGSKQ